jgi:AcrR family transcriptional regulator
MALRAEQVQLTRRAIVDTFLELSGEADSPRVTVAAVSARSGISPATIYRHFPDRDALVDAAANRDSHLGGPAEGPWRLADLAEHLRVLWGSLGENPVVARQAVVTDAGREMRVARHESFRRTLALAVDAAAPTLGHRAVDVVVANINLLTSAFAFLDLHDRQGFDPETAVEVAIAGVEAQLRAVGIDPERFVMTDQGDSA